MTASVDALVVGSGPAGSTAAKKIAERGFSVCLVEKALFPGQKKACGGDILRADFERLGLDSSLVDKYIDECNFFFGGEPLSYQGLALRSVKVQRESFDRSLAGAAAEAGAKLLTTTMVVDIRLDGKAHIFMKQKGGQSVERDADIVIFADGAASLAQKLFGLGFSPKPQQTGLGMVYELDWPRNHFSSFEFYFDQRVSSWGYGWVFPGRDKVNVGVASLVSKLHRNIRESLRYLVESHPIASQKLRGRRVLEARAGLIPLKPAERVVAERMMVVGDAAGLADPLWGGGISHAIVSGRIAGEVAAKALEEHDFSEEALSEYPALWRKTQNSRSIRSQQWKYMLALAASSLYESSYLLLVEYMVKMASAREGPPAH